MILYVDENTPDVGFGGKSELTPKSIKPVTITVKKEVEHDREQI